MSDPARIKPIVIGTAGHVDHGKSRLILALTGVDPDRLKEEKVRGMTIDLGFAWLTTPSGERVGIVDVPGHERFLKNMLAGATGVDIALLVVAADEGVMPQTREHLDILRILDTKNGLVALTKTDLVEPEWIDLVRDDIKSELAGTFLEDAPIIPVSAETGEGIEDLRRALFALVDQVPSGQRAMQSGFRLPVDRVFTLTGFGTVVTGTLASGTIRVGDAVEILPSGLESRVRQLQVHGVKVDQALAGTRVAVNLVGLDVDDIQRGDVCASPGFLSPTRLLDLHVSLLPNSPSPLESGKRVRLYVGTAEVIGRMALLDTRKLPPGQSAFAQFRAERPMVAANGDRFVLRSYSPMHTIGGGVVLDAAPARSHRAGDPSVIETLRARLEGSPADIAARLLSNSGALSAEALARAASWTTEHAAEVLAALAADGRAVKLGSGAYGDASACAQLRDRIISTLQDFHSSQPSKTGMQKEDLSRTCGTGSNLNLLSAVLADLYHEQRIVLEGNVIRLAEHKPGLTEQQQDLARRITARYAEAGLAAPTQQELLNSLGKEAALANDVLAWLVTTGELVKIDDGLLLHGAAVAEAERLLREYLAAHPDITVAQFRDLTGSSRKYAVPLLEYFDAQRVTRRTGDVRRLFGRRG